MRVGVAERIINTYYYVQLGGQIHAMAFLLWREESPVPTVWDSVWVLDGLETTGMFGNAYIKIWTLQGLGKWHLSVWTKLESVVLEAMQTDLCH